MLQAPMELPASSTYTQPEREAIDVGGAKSAVVFLEIYRNSGGTGGPLTVNIQHATRTPGDPYVTGSTGFVTSGTFSITTATVGTQVPIGIAALGELMRFTISGTAITAAIQFSITVYLYDT